MRRARFLLTVLATCSTAIVAAIGCATGGDPSLGPDVDSNLPSLDKPGAGDPAEGGSTLPPSSSDDDASVAPSPSKDAGADASKPVDAGWDASKPVDAGFDAGPKLDAGDAGATAPKPAQGEVLITEVMYNPSGSEPQGEWIEVYNAAASARSLSGLVLVDGADRTHTIGAGVELAPGAYAVLVRSQTGAIAAKVPAGTILHEYGEGLPSNAGVLLANGATGGVALKDGATIIAQSTYGGWFSASGASIQLATPSFAGGADMASWCVSANAWAAGADLGTPGAASDCP